MRNRTADLLLTMETLYRLSYRGQPRKKITGRGPRFSNRPDPARTQGSGERQGPFSGFERANG